MDCIQNIVPIGNPLYYPLILLQLLTSVAAANPLEV